MFDRNFFINPKAVLFHEELDSRNGYETIACNWSTEAYIKVNSSAYKILRVIDEQPGLSCTQITDTVKLSENAVERFLEQMIKENIVFAK